MSRTPPPVDPATTTASSSRYDHARTATQRPTPLEGLVGAELVVESLVELGAYAEVSLWVQRQDEAECLAASGTAVEAGRGPGDRAPEATLRHTRPGAQPPVVVELPDDQGHTVGLLVVRSVDDAENSSDPRHHDRRHDPRRLERYSERARRAVLAVLDREDLEQRVRLARDARQAVRRATERLSLSSVLAECRAALQDAFGASEVWIRLDEDEPPEALAEMRGMPPLPVVAPDLMGQLQRRAWQRQESVVMTVGQPAPEAVGPDEVALLEEVMRARGIGSSLLAPLGSGADCLGRLVLNRAPGQRVWTEVEADSALDIGKDLGRAVLSSRTYEREHELVKQLQEVDSYKTRLITTVAHELKTPLTSVLGNLELLGEPLDVVHERRVLATAHRGARRLASLVDDLLLLSRVADDVPVRREPVDLTAVVRDVVELVSASVRRGAHVIEVDVPPVPVLAYGDPAQIDRVVSNLVSNAMTYSEPGTRIRLRVAQGDGEVVLDCVDQGIGMSPDDLRRLFSEFFRSADDWAQRQPGSGLGLSIVERIVAQHGGRIEVTSQVGEGSTFTVRLPAAG